MSDNDTTLPGCIICGGTQYGPGPNGRLSATGKNPRCAGCGSLERHRRLRQLYGQIPSQFLATLEILQLSPDIGVDPAWFESYELSEYGGPNSLDLQAIDRADASYDLVICNHVLEHVADDIKGLQELMRIVRADGFVQLTVPSPYLRETTWDWGYPDEASHGHYRGYGREFIKLFKRAVPDATVLEVETIDEVTGAGDYIYLWSRDADLIQRFKGWIADPITVAA